MSRNRLLHIAILTIALSVFGLVQRHLRRHRQAELELPLCTACRWPLRSHHARALVLPCGHSSIHLHCLVLPRLLEGKKKPRCGHPSCERYAHTVVRLDSPGRATIVPEKLWRESVSNFEPWSMLDSLEVSDEDVQVERTKQLWAVDSLPDENDEFWTLREHADMLVDSPRLKFTIATIAQFVEYLTGTQKCEECQRLHRRSVIWGNKYCHCQLHWGKYAPLLPPRLFHWGRDDDFVLGAETPESLISKWGSPGMSSPFSHHSGKHATRSPLGFNSDTFHSPLSVYQTPMFANTSLPYSPTPAISPIDPIEYTSWLLTQEESLLDILAHTRDPQLRNHTKELFNHISSLSEAHIFMLELTETQNQVVGLRDDISSPSILPINHPEKQQHPPPASSPPPPPPSVHLHAPAPPVTPLPRSTKRKRHHGLYDKPCTTRDSDLSNPTPPSAEPSTPGTIHGSRKGLTDLFHASAKKAKFGKPGNRWVPGKVWPGVVRERVRLWDELMEETPSRVVWASAVGETPEVSPGEGSGGGRGKGWCDGWEVRP